jgi:hypothetical protein
MTYNDLSREERFIYLKQNKAQLLNEKKSQTKFTDSFSHPAITSNKEVKTKGTKATSSTETSDVPEVEIVVTPDTLDVKVVCNTALFCDSQMDVLTKNSYTNSVNTKGILIPHIVDHKQCATAHVGDVTAVYTKEMALKELGLDKPGTTTALIMETTIRKDYNPDVYKFYNNGKINQHSIGLRYNDIKMAIHSYEKGYEEELAIWKEYYPQLINPEVADEKGYFWLVDDINIIENSCVLFGANALTPTLSVKNDLLTTPTIQIEELNILPQKTETKTDINSGQQGEKMNIEELQAEVIKLNAELTKANSEMSLVIAKAKSSEQGRILGIVDASKTFGTPLEAAIKFVKLDSTVDMAVGAFETMKEFSQNENSIDTNLGSKSTLTKDNTKFQQDEESHPLQDIVKAMTSEITKSTSTII